MNTKERSSRTFPFHSSPLSQLNSQCRSIKKPSSTPAKEDYIISEI